MKRKLRALVLLMVVALLLTAAVSAKEATYSRPRMTFTLPDGWGAEAVPDDANEYEICYVHEDRTAVILYGQEDIWRTLTAAEKKVYTRELLDRAYHMTRVAEEMGLPVSAFEKITCGENTFFLAELTEYADNGTVYRSAIWRENGYLHVFTYSGVDGAHYEDFLGMLEGVQFKQTAYPMVWGTIIMLLVTAVFQLGPVAFYRYRIRKKPVSQLKALVIALIYCFCMGFAVNALLALTDLMGYSVGSVFWGIAEFLMLCKGRKPEAQQPAVCASCGTELKPDAKFCTVCGTPTAVPGETEEIAEATEE